MITLIVSVLFGLIVALFAMQNTNGAQVHVAQYQFAQVPVYIIMMGSLLLGILLSWVVSLVDGLGSFFTLQKKEHSLKSANKTITQLQQRLAEVEKENAVLRGEEEHLSTDEQMIPEDTPQVYRPNFLQRLKYTPKPA